MRSHSRNHYVDNSGLTYCSRCFGADHQSRDCRLPFASQCDKCQEDFSLALYHSPDKCDQVQSCVANKLRGRKYPKKLIKMSQALNNVNQPIVNTISVNKLERFLFPNQDI